MGAPLKVEAIAQALEASVGNISHAARSLKVTRQTLYNRIKESPTLKAALEDARETALDNAESALQSAVLAKEAWAVCFTLKTIGKGRGYIERGDSDSVIAEILAEIARLGFGGAAEAARGTEKGSDSGPGFVN
jgi:hypothetical protein